MKILITGFEPFGGETINPSCEAVRLLPDRLGEHELTKLLLPVEFGRASELAWKSALENDVRVILCIGLAGGRNAVTPEQVAINLRNGSSGGRYFKDEPVIADAPTAYFSELPIRKMTERLCAAGIPSRISYSAGTYVCNDTMYALLHHAWLHKHDCGEDIRVGFVHLPFLPEQARAGAFSLPLDTLIEALKLTVSAI